ncbi:hypothetical protein PtA15_5A810 [Puccinia triticina]|uniref:Uncharacterized protein n=1 Tax=Puccinia triticina TaxID=208348 RepID=A0ABY7CJ28_9BASI|nr:uncharacterized protein PtA15_5A810 [Puccinia triticina]WAQ85236.1 hypothetical protein PtA15_5A810 [Puccinia triticina]
MPKQDFKSGPLLGSDNKDIIGLVLNYILTSSSRPSTENIPAVIRDFLKSRFVSSTHAVAGPETSHLVTLGLIICFLSFIFQLTWFTIGLRYSKLSNSHWVFRNNERGLFVPNTRFLMAILGAIFTLLLVSETVLLILDMNGFATLKDRIIIAGFKWMPLWLSSWVYVWGMGSSIYTTYSQVPHGILGKLVGCKRSALAFNTMVFTSLVFIILYETTTVFFAGYGLMSRLDSFHRISARFETMAALYNPQTFTIDENLLPELPGLLELTVSFANWLKDFRFLLYSRLAWFFGFICISLPLYYTYFRMIQKMKMYRRSITPKSISSLGQPFSAEENGYRVRCHSPSSQFSTFWGFIVSDSTHLILASLLSLVHALVEVTLMIRFICLLKKSGNVSAQVTLLTKTAVTNNFIFAFTGLLPSWMFSARSRLNHKTDAPTGTSTHTPQLNPRVNPMRSVTNDLFDSWTITPSVMGELHQIPEVMKQESYFVVARPRLKHFPDISSVKQFCPQDVSKMVVDELHPKGIV